MNTLNQNSGSSNNGSNNSKSWTAFGKLVEEFEIEYLNPNHHGYTAWPGGDRFIKLLNTDWNTNIVFTQGLSSAENNAPFEIYLESTDPAEPFSSSWQANLVYEIGRIIPNVKDIAQRMEKFKYLSVQVVVEGAPDDWSFENANGNIGLFIGLPDVRLDSFKANFIPLNIKLMRPAETKYILANGAAGRLKIAELYEQQGNATLSYMDRPPVI